VIPKIIVQSVNWLHGFLKFIIGLIICFAIYDIASPIYKDQTITNIHLTDAGLQGDVQFIKKRFCAPTSGTATAFLSFGETVRFPARLLKNGKPLVLQNFPPSKTPTSVRLTWVLPEGIADPTGMSMGFSMKCKLPILRHVEWYSDVNLEVKRKLFENREN